MSKQALGSEKVSATESDFRKVMLSDFRMACISREASLLGRKEVLTGKAKFGIFGDGKELAQIAMARQFKAGDFRSGYYRDQTFMFALDLLSVRQYFAALYAHTSEELEPMSAGRQMNGHYATHSLNLDGSWKNLANQFNSSSDISPTGGQMPRLLGLAQASALFRKNKGLSYLKEFSDNGNEVAFGTIGDASTSEGMFWETMNAAAVLRVPLAMSVWDDGWGISVPKKFQTVKESISEALKGFQIKGDSNGIRIFKARGWNYPELLVVYEEAIDFCRREHVPVLIHVEEVTQPQGHSTSGSHERYKSKEQLAWTEEYDCLRQFRKFIVLEGAATEAELDQITEEARNLVKEGQKEAWQDFRDELDAEKADAITILDQMIGQLPELQGIAQARKELFLNKEAIRKDILDAMRSSVLLAAGRRTQAVADAIAWLKTASETNYDRYSAHLWSESAKSALNVPVIAPLLTPDAEQVDGRVLLNRNFERIFEKYPEVLTFGEDTGKIGGVNQSMEGMQLKFGEERVFDVGIRETTILGQGIGLAMRGLRPIAEIQYLDYMYYALQIMRDDLATVRYRTKGRQMAPVIVRTRGHRLEGIWHSGSPMGAIIHSVRGMWVCVPRNMMQAAGMYNTLLQGDDPALIVEPLNGYRLKETLPANVGEYTIPLGIPEIVKEGSDITIVSYGSTFNICAKAAAELEKKGISAELVDVRTLLPFDRHQIIVESIRKTSRVLFVDEDVPGGATAFMLDQVINVQGAWKYLDSEPKTLSARNHLPAYGTDGDYFSKPSLLDVVEKVYDIMSEANPAKYPSRV
jgi:pyruvate/2-oxoglutarate/acetoin dehydrogenase E1 component/TPP-dependent pyruvate/acetoin dehydrogenase alpha subunit